MGYFLYKRDFFFLSASTQWAHLKTYATLQFINRRKITFQYTEIPSFTMFYCSLKTRMFVAASCDECEKDKTHFFLLRRGGGGDGWEPVRRADGIPVCLVCLKNTAGEAPSQTRQPHGLGWSQSFHSCFPPRRHQDWIPPRNRCTVQCNSL